MTFDPENSRRMLKEVERLLRRMEPLSQRMRRHLPPPLRRRLAGEQMDDISHWVNTARDVVITLGAIATFLVATGLPATPLLVVVEILELLAAALLVLFVLIGLFKPAAS